MRTDDLEYARSGLFINGDLKKHHGVWGKTSRCDGQIIVMILKIYA